MNTPAAGAALVRSERMGPENGAIHTTMDRFEQVIFSKASDPPTNPPELFRLYSRSAEA